MESEVLHLLYQILSGVAVITDLQRIDLVLFYQLSEPVESIMIINKIITAWMKKTSLDVKTIRHTVSLCSFVYLLCRKEHLAEHIQFTGLLDHDRAGRQVSRLRQVDAADTVGVPEVFQAERITAGIFHGLCVQPGCGAVLLQAAVLGDELGLLRERSFRNGDLFEHVVHGNGNTEIWIRLPQFVDVIPLLDVINHVQERQQLLFLAVAQ